MKTVELWTKLPGMLSSTVASSDVGAVRAICANGIQVYNRRVQMAADMTQLRSADIYNRIRRAIGAAPVATLSTAELVELVRLRLGYTAPHVKTIRKYIRQIKQS